MSQTRISSITLHGFLAKGNISKNKVARVVFLVHDTLYRYDLALIFHDYILYSLGDDPDTNFQHYTTWILGKGE